MNSIKFAIIFAISTVLMVGLAGLFNFIVDPFDHHNHELFAPRSTDGRESLLKVIDTWPKKQAAVIFGSSRSLCVPSELVSEYLGKPTHRALVPGMNPWDYTQTLQYIVEEAEVPVSDLVLGIDITGIDSRGTSSGGQSFDSLRTLLPDFLWRYELPYKNEKWQDDFNLINVGRNLKWLLMQSRMGQLQGHEATFTLRTCSIYLQDSDVNTQWLVSKWFIGEGSQAYRSQFQSTNRNAIRQLEELLVYADANGIAVHVYVTPVHPQYGDYLSKTGYADRIGDVRNIIEPFVRQGNVKFSDLSDISVFGGDPNNFEDGVHYTGKNGELLVNYLLGRTK